MASKLFNFRRFLAPQNVRQYSEGLPENLREAMKRFQADDGVPVYLKGGSKDRLLFGATIIVIAVGLVETARTIYQLHNKK